MKHCDKVFKITKEFPKEEVCSLAFQINGSVISIPSNIAEGSSRSSNKEFKRFLEIALGSLFELQTQIVLSYYKEYINKVTLIGLEDEIEELQKMVLGFKNSLN
ncbi:four helix bundle protein [Tenacibaculum sp. 1_MG-2023]|uniref:four helix bundle protein n=1 Tax=Tenacibaculum sp. 1_MG-2023 TaxID=3062653 RepID=UPI0026E1EF04|nr:four helix bundle protein [Tenacibaculum sp. 1_MG-2023]MDO6675852.1 four helix bundle protein [Tenacibaculum sp. 1_MG-2023]